MPRVRLGLPLAPDPGILTQHIDGIVERGRYSNAGPLVSQLEDMLQKLLDVPCAVAVSSGTAAISLALMTLDLPAGSDIITTPLTFTATAQAIVAAGHRPLFVDVRPDDGTLDAEAVHAAITARTGAVLGVHLFGSPCDDTSLRRVTSSVGLPLLYDGAHAFGASVRHDGTEVSVGRLGDLSTFSLHATKLVHTGEGGLVTSNDDCLHERLKRGRNFGLEGVRTVAPGLNFKMSEMSAALGLAVLPRLRAEEAARALLRLRYDNIVADHPELTPHPVASGRVANLFYALRAPESRRDSLVRALTRAGVEPRTFESLTHPKSWIRTTSPPSRTPHADALAAQILCLPLHSGVEEGHLSAVRATLRTAF